MHIKLHYSSSNFFFCCLNQNRSPNNIRARNKVFILLNTFNYPFQYDFFLFGFVNRVVPSCREDEFECDNHCHPRSIQCNGTYECDDGSDEENCPATTTTTTTSTTQAPEVCFFFYDFRFLNFASLINVFPNHLFSQLSCPEYTCPDGKYCFGVADRCNGISECSDGYDEYGCPRKLNYYFS